VPRIVSLISSATEIVDALGMTGHLVGRSHECDYPEAVRSLPLCPRDAHIARCTAQIADCVRCGLAEGRRTLISISMFLADRTSLIRICAVVSPRGLHAMRGVRGTAAATSPLPDSRTHANARPDAGHAERVDNLSGAAD